MTPAHNRTSKQDTRAALIEAGTAMILEKGFNFTGIEPILKSVGVPKGSFYYYFPSKEAFGLAVLEAQAEKYRTRWDDYFTDKTRTPLARIRHYFEESIRLFEARECRNGCLFGNLGQEMADQNDAFRSQLAGIFADWRNRLAACFQEAQDACEISPSLSPTDLAEFCLNSWEGAVLRAKVTKSADPMRLFVEMLFQQILNTSTSKK